MMAADAPTAPITEPRSSFSDRPVTVQSTPDFQFLSATGEVTLIEFKTTQTATPTQQRPLRVPRLLTFEAWSQLGFILLQKWDGVVLDVDNENFTAKLIDSDERLPNH